METIATPASESPTCGVRRPGWENGPAIGRHRIPCVLDSGHQGVHRDGLGQTWGETASAQPRYMGRDADGKHIHVSAAPGGLLERIADQHDVEAAHVLTSLVRSVLDSEQPPRDAELAAFVPLMADALERVTEVAARRL